MEVNGRPLFGLAQSEVVRIFKDMPSRSELIVKRASGSGNQLSLSYGSEGFDRIGSVRSISILHAPRPPENPSYPQIQVTVDSTDSGAGLPLSGVNVPNIIGDDQDIHSMPYIRRQSVIPGSLNEADEVTGHRKDRHITKNKMLSRIGRSRTEPVDKYPEELKMLMEAVATMEKSEGLQSQMSPPVSPRGHVPRQSTLDENFYGSRHSSRPPSRTPSRLEHTSPVSRSHSFSIASSGRIASFDGDAGFGRSNLMPLPGDVPEGMNAHLVEMEKPENASLGISLVPGHGKCEGFFQVFCLFS